MAVADIQMYLLNNTFPLSALKLLGKLQMSYHWDETPFSALENLWNVISIFNREVVVRPSLYFNI